MGNVVSFRSRQRSATRNPLASPAIRKVRISNSTSLAVSSSRSKTHAGILPPPASSRSFGSSTSALRGELDETCSDRSRWLPRRADRIAEVSVLAWLPFGMSYGVSKMWSATPMRIELARCGAAAFTWAGRPSTRQSILPMVRGTE